MHKWFYYEILSHTADFKVRFFGKNLNEFCKAIVSFFQNEIYIIENDSVDIYSTNLINNEENLSYFIVEILNEIIYFGEKNFTIMKIEEKTSNNFELSFCRHDFLEFKIELKAATYHNLKMIGNLQNIQLEIVFDL